MITITSTLTKKDFKEVNKVLRKSNKALRFLPILGYFFCFMGLINLLIEGFGTPQIAILLIGLNFVFLIPYLQNRAVDKAYDSNLRMSEVFACSFDETTFYTKSESSSSEMSLDKIYKISESKDYLFIWQSKQVANPISKTNMKDGDMWYVKSIFSKYPQVINKLK